MARKFGIFTEVDSASGEFGDVDTLLGTELSYDEGFEEGGDAWEREYENSGYNIVKREYRDAYNSDSKIAKKLMNLGLPPKIQGDLGCGCAEAVLHGAGEIINGQVEVDYMCDYGFHNYMVFQMRMQGKKPERDVKIDKFGGLTTEKSFQAQELEEF